MKMKIYLKKKRINQTNKKPIIFEILLEFLGIPAEFYAIKRRKTREA